MSPEETIRAAIAKLELQRAAATQPTGGRTSWTQGRDDVQYESAREIYTGPMSLESQDVATGIFTPADAELIVTLHRTIDAQLAILRMALRVLDRTPRLTGWVESVGALGLARAILEEPK